MKILVTGANGYIGQGVVEQLIKLNHNVVATDYIVENINQKAKCIPANIFKICDPYEYFDKPDVLLHLAWRDGFKHASDNHMLDLPNHYMFIKKMIDSGIKKIVVMGSMHEVGFFEGSINENSPCEPQSLYGIAKNTLRQATNLLAQSKGTAFQWLRGYYIVGNTKFGCSIFSKIAQAANEGTKDFPFTMGQNQYDFIDYDDFCKQVAFTVSQDAVNGIINCCSGQPEKLADRVERFIEENNYEIKLIYGKFPDRPYDSKAVWGNSKKIDIIMNKANREE